MTKALVLSASLLLGSVAWADEHELHENMEKIGKAMGVLRKSVPAKSMTDVASAAGVMAEAFPKTIHVWEEKKMADAVQWTKDSEALAKELKMAAEAGHAEHVSAVFGKLGGTCKSCHVAHREEIPGSDPKKYKIK